MKSRVASNASRVYRGKQCDTKADGKKVFCVIEHGKGIKMAKELFEAMDETCAFDKGKRTCAALNVKNCDGCKFRKSEEELIRGRERAAARVKTFTKEYRAHIKARYYSQKEQAY